MNFLNSLTVKDVLFIVVLAILGYYAWTTTAAKNSYRDQLKTATEQRIEEYEEIIKQDQLVIDSLTTFKDTTLKAMQQLEDSLKTITEINNTNDYENDEIRIDRLNTADELIPEIARELYRHDTLDTRLD